MRTRSMVVEHIVSGACQTALARQCCERMSHGRMSGRGEAEYFNHHIRLTTRQELALGLRPVLCPSPYPNLVCFWRFALFINQ
eukprot:207144-Chlamydomonas_euryale.AAC.3